MTPRGVDFDPNDPLIRALRALPEPRAPRTLAPRVMAAVQARLAHPPARTWFDWPLAGQIASVMGALLVLAGVVFVWPVVVGWGQPTVEAITSRVTAAVDIASVVLSLAGVAFRAVWYPFVLPFMVFVTAMTIVSATVGALLGRVALGGVSR